jgi:hypothetical protein
MSGSTRWHQRDDAVVFSEGDHSPRAGEPQARTKTDAPDDHPDVG